MSELERTTREPVKPGELSRAKEFYLGQMELGLENSMTRMLWAGESLVCLERVRTPDEVQKIVQKITARDIRRVAKELLGTRAFNLAIVGPKADSMRSGIEALLA